MTFDVAITTYRRPEYAVAAVRSCLNQGHHLSRVIVVDDASGDSTGVQISALNDPRVLYQCRSQNGGMSAARHDALALSTADWTIHLDDDWELLSGAIPAFSELARSAPANTVMLGSRMKWDHGGVSPLVVPTEPIDYAGQIRWRSRRDGLAMDNVCAVSRLARQHVQWLPVRDWGHGAILFYLNAARLGCTIYTSAITTLQKGCMAHSASRGSPVARLQRRKLDAAGELAIMDQLFRQHGPGLQAHGPRLLANLLVASSMYHLVSGHRDAALACALRAARTMPISKHAISMVLFSLLGQKAYELAYRIRG
jgi:hypothetical protein